MNANPWQQKETIETALRRADQNGFRLDRHHNYGDKICLYTKGANEHGFANCIMLEAFDDWHDVGVFLAGWEKHELAMRFGK